MRRRVLIVFVIGAITGVIACSWRVHNEKYSPARVRDLLVADTTPPSSFDRLMKRVGWDRRTDPNRIAQRIVDLGPKGVPGLAAALSDPSPRVRRRAAWALGEIGDPAVVGPLIASLNDRETSVRGEATQALGSLRDPRAVDPLVKVLRADAVMVTSEDKPFSISYGVFTGISVKPISYYAAEALCRIGNEEALNALVEFCMADRTDGPMRLAFALRESEPEQRDRVIAAVKARDKDAADRFTEYVDFWTRIDRGKQ